MKWLTIGGLVLNFIGTLMVALSFGKNLADAYQTDKRGRKVYLASFLYPRLFWLGLGLFGAGFLCQIVPEAARVIAMP